MWFNTDARHRFAAEAAWKLRINGAVSPLDWEEIVAYALGGKVYGGDVYLADVVVNKTQFSVKSLRKSVVYRKTMENKNIFNNPSDVLEVIERRVSIPYHPEEDPYKIGVEIMRNQEAYERLSLEVYRLENTVDLLINYGFDDDRDPKYFGWNVYIYHRNKKNYNPDKYRWDRTFFGDKSRHAGKVAKIVAYDKKTDKLVYYWNTPYNSRQTINLVHMFHTNEADEVFFGKIRLPERIIRPSDKEILKNIIENI